VLASPSTSAPTLTRPLSRSHTFIVIEKATLRLVAIRESRNLSSAAAPLGMAPVSLSRWIGRRKLPMHVER